MSTVPITKKLLLFSTNEMLFTRSDAQGTGTPDHDPHLVGIHHLPTIQQTERKGSTAFKPVLEYHWLLTYFPSETNPSTKSVNSHSCTHLPIWVTRVFALHGLISRHPGTSAHLKGH